MSKIGACIIRGMKEAIAFAEGTADMSLYRVHVPPEIDVKAIRGRLGLTQQQLAGAYAEAVCRSFRIQHHYAAPLGAGKARSRGAGAGVSAGD